MIFNVEVEHERTGKRRLLAIEGKTTAFASYELAAACARRLNDVAFRSNMGWSYRAVLEAA